MLARGDEPSQQAVRVLGGRIVLVDRGDRGIASIAAHQHGHVATAQLNAIGLGRNAIAHRVAQGRLHPIHRGVLRVAGAEPAAIAAALLAAVPAVASHRSAASLWHLLPHQPGSVHVTIARARRVERHGITVHRCDLPADEIRLRHGLPATSAARTLLDLAATRPAAELARAAANAYVAGLARERELEAVLRRHAGRPGTTALRRVLDGGLHRTRSNPERDLAAVCAAARLPAPRMNATVEGFLVDAHWPEHRLVVEVDTLGTHGHARAFAADHHRDLVLQAAGIAVLRITDDQLEHDRPAVTATLAATLARRRSRGRRT